MKNINIVNNNILPTEGKEEDSIKLSVDKDAILLDSSQFSVLIGFFGKYSLDRTLKKVS